MVRVRLLGAAGASGNASRARFGAPSALESAAGASSAPQVRSKVLLGPAPELPDAPKCCSGLLRSRLCTRNGCLGWPQSCQVGRKACPSQLRNRTSSKKVCRVILNSACASSCYSKSLFECQIRKSLVECAARNYCSKSHVSVTLYSHPLHTVLLAKCMECTGSH